MRELNKKKLDGRYDEQQKVYNVKYEASSGGVQRRKEYRQKLKDLRELEGRTRKPNPDNRLRIAYYQKVVKMLPVPVKMCAALQYLGMSFPIFKKWIEYNLAEDITWENMSQVWRLEHIPPKEATTELITEVAKYDSLNWKNWTVVRVGDKHTIVCSNKEKANEFLATLA